MQILGGSFGFQGPTILLGDFIMVEAIGDRWGKKSKVIFGAKLKAWALLSAYYELVDCYVNNGSTWNNPQTWASDRAVRINWVYLSRDLVDLFDNIDSNFFDSLHMFDHVFVIISSITLRNNLKQGGSMMIPPFLVLNVFKIVLLIFFLGGLPSRPLLLGLGITLLKSATFLSKSLREKPISCVLLGAKKLTPSLGSSTWAGSAMTPPHKSCLTYRMILERKSS